MAARQLAINPQPQQVPTNSEKATIRLITPIEIPPLPFTTWDGQHQMFQATDGKALLVNFWASWCDPCRKELKEFGDAEKEIRQRGLDILALSVDEIDGRELSADSGKEFLASVGFPFRSGRATSGLLGRLEALHARQTSVRRDMPLPFSVLIDSKGQLAAFYKGPIDIQQVLEDVHHSHGTLMERFQRAAAFRGRVLQHEVARNVLERTEADRRFKFAHLFRNSGLLKLAADQYKTIIDVWPDSEIAHSEFGALLGQQGQMEEAKESLKKALQINPEYSAAHINLGSLYLKNKQYSRALIHYNKANELSPNDAQILHNRGLIYSAMDKVEQALDDYNAAIELNPNFVVAYDHRGDVFQKLGKLDPAIADFSRVLQRNKNYAPAYKKRGNALLKSGRNSEALNDYTSASSTY